ncbi:HIT domain-containing protein [Photobacterium damselae]|uniref:HIT domain-containing protein n=1 Tax=Photobacterium damselae subsp. damselae TaxID=85581 RepID=A0AAD3ZWC2_PHODD|nr:HIT family protein [Photobacterium damselae]KAB1182175.1 HIT domain-containing protein [Photobacterium damselae subsp. damselae]MCG3815266.1 HIT domain-containing protein [Photobacterium damselae]PSB84670.1 diadenosine tetraphosphate hydrolase [Photobacterium damselae subsp. damselae]UKA01015.1 HIT family protein [Photobacterium damselae subsp. damselae]UKA28379.1 HIT domain-containing protein [Photobacterium damselae subsp. damselae]
MSFTLHERLVADTSVLGDFPLSRVLLAKEALGPWIILVPKKDNLREIHHLSEQEQIQLIKESCLIAQLLETDYKAEKINVGALGNLVPQLHLHHIARFSDDIAWPGPIWGNTKGIQRSEAVQQALVEELQSELEQQAEITFIPA